MSITSVFTLTGPDRIGIVEEVTKTLLDLGANVESSRMARLGGEFAILMLVTLPEDRAQALDAAMDNLSAQGYRVSTATASDEEPSRSGWSFYEVTVHGADHEGIVHEIASGLSQRGISIESMDTETSRAPVTGASLFEMTARVAVPPHLTEPAWVAEVEEAAANANVDVRVSRVVA